MSSDSISGLKSQLYSGDCLEEIKRMGPCSVDLALTDPPYNLGLFMKDRATNLARMRENYFGAAGWDNASVEEWEQLMDKFFLELSRVMKTGGSVIIFMSLIKVETVIRLASRYGFYYKTTGIWHKTNPMPRNMNLHFVNSTEGWIYFTFKSRRGIFNNKGKLQHDFVESSVTRASEKRFGKHPTQKPEVILRGFVELLTDPGQLVFDPFMGSGSTGVAAIKEKRDFIGIELDAKYFGIASARIKDAENSYAKWP